MSAKPRLRVAVVTRAVYPLHGYGGLERHAYDLIRHLLVRDVEVVLITQPPTRAFVTSAAATLEHPGLTLRHVPYRTFPFAGRRGTTIVDRCTAYLLFGRKAGRLAALLAAAGQVDLVYGLGASVLGYAMARKRSRQNTVPLVFNPQGLEEFGATDPRRARMKRLAYAPLRSAVRTCARAADYVIATDHVLAPVVETHLGTTPSRVRIVPNGIDTEVCDRLAGPEQGRRMRERHAMAAGDIVLLSVGRIEENKGFQTLARALADLAARPGQVQSVQSGSGRVCGSNTSGHRRWRWVLIGDGPFRARLVRLIVELGLTDRVLLRGRVEDDELHAWYEAATLFVHPAYYEGSSLVTLEAMAHRRAVVCTTAGGLPDKVKTGTNGWLVEPNDTGMLSDTLREAMSCGDSLNAMGAASRVIVEREFAWTVVVDRLLAVFSEAMEGRC